TARPRRRAPRRNGRTRRTRPPSCRRPRRAAGRSGPSPTGARFRPSAWSCRPWSSLSSGCPRPCARCSTTCSARGSPRSAGSRGPPGPGRPHETRTRHRPRRLRGRPGRAPGRQHRVDNALPRGIPAGHQGLDGGAHGGPRRGPPRRPLARRARPRPGWLFVPFLAYAAANAAWVTPVRWLGWTDWLNWAQAAAVFWVVLNGVTLPACRRFLCGFLVVLGEVAALLACYQHFVRPDWLMLGRTQAAQFIGRSSGPFG